MKIIPLSQGQVARVDDEDYEKLARHNWCYRGGYAVRKDAETRKVIIMHRQILGIEDKRVVSHINGINTDNTKENLKVMTISQHRACREKLHTKSSSPYKGVSWREDDQKWGALITHDNKRIYLGKFTDEREAALAYNTAATKLFGEYAILNNIKYLEDFYHGKHHNN